MSREARMWVWEEAPVDDPRQLLILLSMADVADERGSGAYPSKSRMARDSRSNERTVQRHLSALVKSGVIDIESPSAGHKPTTFGFPYMKARGDTLSPLPPSRGDTGETNPGSSPINGIGSNSCDAKNPESDPLRGFDKFWPAYPKRNNKRLNRARCEALWAKLPIEEKRSAFRGAKNYGAAIDAGLTIAKDPDRWLRDKCWVDWQDPAAADTRPTGATPSIATGSWADNENPAYYDENNLYIGPGSAGWRG